MPRQQWCFYSRASATDKTAQDPDAHSVPVEGSKDFVLLDRAGATASTDDFGTDAGRVTMNMRVDMKQRWPSVQRHTFDPVHFGHKVCNSTAGAENY